jgi:hypothetical protein
MEKIEVKPDVSMDELTNKVANIKITEKEKKKNLTAYWGVDLDMNILDKEEIKDFLELNPLLIKNKKIHCTLLYVGKKEGNINEEKFKDLEGKEVFVNITGFGYSKNAMALQVDLVSYVNDNSEIESVSFFGIQKHITVALKEGVKAVDSVKTLLGEGTLNVFKNEYIVKGGIKRYLF